MGVPDDLKTMKSASRFFFLLLHTVIRTVPPSVWASGAAAAIVLAIGCQTPPTSASKLPSKERPNSLPDTAIALREGDFVKISFPNTPKLDSAQRVRRDGKIVLPVFGEMKALGLTPLELEKDILKQFGSQLVTKEVTVTLESSSYAVFVNGAVVPKSGVYAVRQGPLLAANLLARLNDKPLETYKHNPNALMLLSLGQKRAVASRNGLTLGGDWVWRWKDKIDREWIQKYAPP